MEKTIRFVLSAGVITLTASVSNPASATSTALSLQLRQGQASAALLEPVGYYRRGYGRHAYRYRPYAIGPTTVPTPTMALPTAITEGHTVTTARAWAGGDLASASGLASKNLE